MLQYFWLVLLIIFIVAECLTVGLISIWFAGGALIAMFFALLGVSTVWQIVVFLVVSAILLIITRPIAVKYINNKKEKTNYQSVIGTVVKVIEKIDNLNQTGAAFTEGKEWTARAIEDNMILEKDTFAKVIEIEGVKLIVEPYKVQESK